MKRSRGEKRVSGAQVGKRFGGRGRRDGPIVIRVIPSSSERIEVWMSASVAKSMLDVASSRINTFDLRTKPR